MQDIVCVSYFIVMSSLAVIWLLVGHIQFTKKFYSMITNQNEYLDGDNIMILLCEKQQRSLWNCISFCCFSRAMILLFYFIDQILDSFLSTEKICRDNRSLLRWQLPEAWPNGLSKAGALRRFPKVDATGCTVFYVYNRWRRSHLMINLTRQTSSIISHLATLWSMLHTTPQASVWSEWMIKSCVTGIKSMHPAHGMKTTIVFCNAQQSTLAPTTLRSSTR